jgi:hypothetical protein
MKCGSSTVTVLQLHPAHACCSALDMMAAEQAALNQENFIAAHETIAAACS